MRITRPPFETLGINITVIIIALTAAGYMGHRYAKSNDRVSCKLGVGGECEIIGICDGYCDVEEVILYWIPVCQEKIIEEEK